MYNISLESDRQNGENLICYQSIPYVLLDEQDQFFLLSALSSLVRNGVAFGLRSNSFKHWSITFCDVIDLAGIWQPFWHNITNRVICDFFTIVVAIFRNFLIYFGILKCCRWISVGDKVRECFPDSSKAVGIRCSLGWTIFSLFNWAHPRNLLLFVSRCGSRHDSVFLCRLRKGNAWRQTLKQPSEFLHVGHGGHGDQVGKTTK